MPDKAGLMPAVLGDAGVKAEFSLREFRALGAAYRREMRYPRASGGLLQTG
jgi:hypothetical protein